MLKNSHLATDATENDRLMAALAYFLTPIVPVIILLVDTMKVRPFQRYHAIQALGYFVVGWVIGSVVLGIVFTICAAITLGIAAICLWVIFFLPLIPAIYYTIIAYQGNYFEIPVVTQFMMQQGWLQAPPQV
jgi:uncharacterized membrane protein